MALLGMKKKMAFGQVPMGPYNTPGIGDGMIERQQMGDPGAMEPNTQAMTKKPSFFGEGGVGRGIAGTIGDVLMQYGGLQPTYGPQMQAQALARQKAMQAQQERQTGWQDWVAKEKYKRENPEPRVNDTEQDYNFWKGKVANGEITQEQFNDKLFAPKYVIDQETGQTIRIGGAPTFAPAPQGVTFTPVDGGQTPTVSGNFPPKPIGRNNSGY